MESDLQISELSVPSFDPSLLFGWSGHDYTLYLKALVSAYGSASGCVHFWDALSLRTWYNSPLYLLTFDSEFSTYADEVGLYAASNAPGGAKLKQSVGGFLDFMESYGIWLLLFVVVLAIIYFIYKIIKS